MPFLFEHYARTIAEHGLAADSRASTGSEDTANSSSPTQAIAQGKALDIIGSTSKQSGDQPESKRAKLSINEPEAPDDEFEGQDILDAVEYELELELDDMLSRGAAESARAD